MMIIFNAPVPGEWITHRSHMICLPDRSLSFEAYHTTVFCRVVFQYKVIIIIIIILPSIVFEDLNSLK